MIIKFPYGIYFKNYEDFEKYEDPYGYLWSYTVWEEVEKFLDEREKLYY